VCGEARAPNAANVKGGVEGVEVSEKGAVVGDAVGAGVVPTGGNWFLGC
jgi:hypothetical protein